MTDRLDTSSKVEEILEGYYVYIVSRKIVKPGFEYDLPTTKTAILELLQEERREAMERMMDFWVSSINDAPNMESLLLLARKATILSITEALTKEDSK